jgi:ATP-dependent Clp protease adaptor protein ClpS
MATKKPPGDPPGPGGPDGPKGPGREGGTQTLERVKTKKPKLWRVVMHNDDYTTQEFVVHVLTSFFRKDPTEATQIMLKVHTTGKAIVAVYTKDLAESKVAQVTDYARDNGHPLMLTLEPDA